MDNIKLTVDGMSCGHCVATVEGALSKLGAIAKVDLATRKVEITYDTNQVTISQLTNAIEDVGFDVIK